MSDWHASVYGSRTGSSGGFGIDPSDYGDSWGSHDGYGDSDDEGGVTFGTGVSDAVRPRISRNHHVVPDKMLRLSAGRAYFRADEVVSSGRMEYLRAQSLPNGNTELRCSVGAAAYGLDDYDASAVIDEMRGAIVNSGCTCPAYGRNGRICKHVVALILSYDRTPELFERQGDDTVSVHRNMRYTSKSLRRLMDAQSTKLKTLAKTRQLNLLKEVGSRASGKDDVPGQQNMYMPAGSVCVRPQLERDDEGHWRLRAHITVPSRRISYVVKNLRTLVRAVNGHDFVEYGQKLAFVHTPESFDERSRHLIAILARALEIRDGVAGERMSLRRGGSEAEELQLSDDEVADILNLYVEADATFDFVPQGMGWNSSLPLYVKDGDPQLHLQIDSYDAHRVADASAGFIGRREPRRQSGERSVATRRKGYLIQHEATVECFVVGHTSSFVVVHPSGEQEHAGEHRSGHTQTMVYRCSQALADNRELLEVLCGQDDGEGLYLEPDDVGEFAQTVLPMLDAMETAQKVSSTSADADSFTSLPDAQDSTEDHAAGETEHGICVTMPDELRKLRRVPCVIETYLDRDENGVTCDIQARYGETKFHVFLGIGPHEPVQRDNNAERLAVEAARHYFPAPDGIFARIAESDDEAIYKLIKEGLPVLRSIGAVYCTPAFDGLANTRHTAVHIGLSIRSGLVDISPIADEIDPKEVPALLKSYHQRRRFHRLSDGSFVDLTDLDTSKLDEVGADLNVKPEDLAAGGVAVPAYAAYYLDDQADEAAESEEFRSYLQSMKQVDPKAYAVPEQLSHVLRPYQREGFRWLNADCDKGFGGILADEMGLGKTVQMLSFLLSRKNDARKTGPSLIVCPASLVYNWEAECAKFVPQLNTVVMAGSKAERRAMLRAIEHAQHCSVEVNVPSEAAHKAQEVAADDGTEGGEHDSSAGNLVEKHDAGLTVPDILVTSYDLLRRDIADYKKADFYCVVLDEAQYIKNHATKSAQAVRAVNALHRFALTGTPIENRLSELWSIFDFLMPGMLGSYRHFRERFEMPILSGDDIVRRKLQAFVGPFILRRLKSEVLKDLPDKIENVLTVRLEGEQRKLYAALEQQLRATLNHQKDIEFKTGKIQILAQITRLRQACCDPRLLFDNVGANVVVPENRVWGAPARTLEESVEQQKQASEEADKSALKAMSHPRAVPSAKLDAIDELVSSCEDAGKKMLIFSQFTSFLDLIAERLRGNGIAYYTITGETPKRKRLDLVDKFNADDTTVFLISLKAGNTGLNLTGASVVVHADPWWNAAAQNQATDRAHRIGQTKDVNVYQIVAKDTIEERILNMQQAKSDLARTFVDSAGTQNSSSVANLTKEDLLALLG